MRTVIDQRGGQTFNRDAKIKKSIGDFACDPFNIAKWPLKKSRAAEIAEQLKIFSG